MEYKGAVILDNKNQTPDFIFNNVEKWAVEIWEKCSQINFIFSNRYETLQNYLRKLFGSCDGFHRFSSCALLFTLQIYGNRHPITELSR